MSIELKEGLDTGTGREAINDSRERCRTTVPELGPSRGRRVGCGPEVEEGRPESHSVPVGGMSFVYSEALENFEEKQDRVDRPPSTRPPTLFGCSGRVRPMMGVGSEGECLSTLNFGVNRTGPFRWLGVPETRGALRNALQRSSEKSPGEIQSTPRNGTTLSPVPGSL